MQPPQPKDSSASGLVGVLLFVGMGLGGWYAYENMGTRMRHDVNAMVSSSGIPMVPWSSRAQTAATMMYAGPDGAGIAQSIQQITHSMGESPQLVNYNVTMQNDVLVSRFDVAWRGGLLGTHNLTSVEWRCNQAGHVSATITQDNGVFAPDDAARVRVDAYFRNTVYPTLARRAN